MVISRELSMTNPDSSSYTTTSDFDYACHILCIETQSTPIRLQSTARDWRNLHLFNTIPQIDCS